MISAWVYLISTAATFVGLWLWDQRRPARRLLAHLPQYSPLPFIGHMHKFYGDGELLLRHIVKISKIVDEKMAPFALWLGPCPIILLHDPEEVKIVTNTFVEKPYYYSFGKLWLGNGLVTASGPVWKRNIKKLAGTFTSSIVEGYQGVFSAQAWRLTDKLKAEVGGKPFHILDKYLSFTTLEAICQTALGLSEVSEIVTTEYYTTFNRTLELMIARGLNVLFHPDFIYRLTPAHREFERCVAVLQNVSETVLARRKSERAMKSKPQEINTDQKKGGGVKFKSFLDILLELSDQDPSFTDQQIKAEVNTIIVGGQETVATTLFHTLLMVGCNPRVQDALYHEIKSILGDSKRPVMAEDLSKMRYCEAVLNETLRLYPPFPGVMRYADRELKMKSCTIPKGTACAVNIWGAGRSERAWGPDAEQYRPERWLGDLDLSPTALMAFSCGRRACIGKKYAMALMKTILACCVRELEFESQAETMKLKLDIALRPVSGHFIQVKLRQHMKT